jgi:hypothetical protein
MPHTKRGSDYWLPAGKFYSTLPESILISYQNNHFSPCQFRYFGGVGGAKMRPVLRPGCTPGNTYTLKINTYFLSFNI